MFQNSEKPEDDEFGRQPLSADEIRRDLEEEITKWQGVTVKNKSAGSIGFWYAGKELGHLHIAGSRRPAADLLLPEDLRTVLVQDGRVFPHINDKGGKTGWVTVPVGTVAEAAFAIELFEYCYDLAAEEETTIDN